MAEQEDEWKAGTRVDMGKGKYFIASAEKGTGAIYGATGSVIQANVKGFRRSDGENGGSVFDYTTDTGLQRTDRYDANGARLGSTNTYKTGKNTVTTEIGKGENYGDSSWVSSVTTVRNDKGDVVRSREGFTESGRRELNGGRPTTSFWDTTPPRPSATQPPATQPPATQPPATQPPATTTTRSPGPGVAYTTRKGLGTLFDSKGRAIGVGGKEDRVLSGSELHQGITYVPGGKTLSEYRDGKTWRTKTGQVIGDDAQYKQYQQAIAALKGTGAYYDRGVFRTRTGAKIGGDLETVKSWAAARAKRQKATGYRAAEKGGYARNPDGLDALIATLDRYGPSERMSGEKELTRDEVTEWEAARLRTRDAGLPVDDSRYRRDEESGKVYRKWSSFDLSDGERKLLGKDPDAEVAALRAMYDYARAGGEGARSVRDIRSLAWNLRRNRALANGGR